MRENTVAEPLSPSEAMYEALHDDAMVCGHEAFGVIEGLQRRGFVIVPAAARRASDAQVADEGTLIVKWLRASHTRRMLARALGGGDHPDDTYLSMATKVIGSVVEQVQKTPWLTHDEPTAAPAPQPATPPLDVDVLGRAMHARLAHSTKYGGGRCRCWGEAHAIAEYARLAERAPETRG